MHDYTMGKIGKHIKENYCPDEMTRSDLNELYCWSKIMKNLLEADKDYHIIISMEENEDSRDVEMTMDEIIPRFTRLYNESSQNERVMMKNKIMNIMS